MSLVEVEEDGAVKSKFSDMKYPINRYKKKIDSAATEEVATRDAAMMVSHLLGVLPNPDPILKKTGKRVEVYRDLMGDWEVFSAVDLVHGGLQDLEWQLEQGDSDAGAFRDFEQRFNDWDIHKILSECVDGRNFGYQPFEFMWVKNSDAWNITNVVGKPPEWFNFNADNELQFKSRSSRTGEPVKPYQFTCAQHRESYQNPYGEAALSRCFWPVTFKKGGIEFMTKFLEKYGIPWVIGKQPRGVGKKKKNELLDDLANMVADAVAVIPDDASVDIKESQGKGGSSDAFKSYIWYFDAAINKVILSSETAMSVSKEGSGEQRGNSQEHAKASKSVIRGIGGMAAKVINQAIKWEWHFNHEGPAPEFSVYAPADVQKDRAERDSNLQGQGVRFKENYYMKHYGFNEDEFEIVEVDPTSPVPGFSQRAADSHPNGCQCTGCQRATRNAQPATFNEESDRNQRLLEEMVEGIGGDESAATNQQLMEAVLEPVMDLIENAASMEEIMQELASTFPEMSTDQLEQRLTSVFFLADIWGRLSAQDEEGFEEDN